jgi:hypothetical protein
LDELFGIFLGNRVQRRVFWHKREKITGGWRKLHNKNHHNLYSSPNIIRAIKSRRIRWMGHVTCVGDMRNVYIILV